MPRIPLLTEATMTLEQKRAHDFVKGRSRDNHVGAPYQLALHCPEFLERWQQVGETLRYYNSLPPALSEMAILITAPPDTTAAAPMPAIKRRRVESI